MSGKFTHGSSEALASLVAALDATNWSSWQQTASFSDQLDAARNAVARERMAEAAPYLLAALKRLIDAHTIPSTACKERPAYEQALAAIAKATGESS